ncbi:MAG: hypothetical protein ACHQUC_05025 [Chlamydiales bacterium]
MSRQTFPVFVDQPLCTMRNFSIDGSAVDPTTAGTGGLDGRGQFLCTIVKAANIVTVNWVPAFADRPYVFFQPAPGQADTLVEIVTSTATTLVYQTFTASTHVALNDADIDVHVDSYGTTSFVS